MQAKDLIVLGSSRLLGKLYCGDIDIGGSASISTISSALSITDTTESSSTTTGALKVSGGVGISKKLYVGGNTYHSGATYFGSTYNISSSGQATLSQVKVGTGSGDTTITNNSATIANINSSTITNSGKITTSAMDVNGKLHAVEYDLENIVDLGGSFIVAPTLMLPVSNATSSNSNLKAKNSGTTTLILTIKDPSITSGGIAGFAWAQNYKVKVSGQINNVVLGTLSGYLNSAANVSSNTLNITLTSVDSAIVSAVGPTTSDTTYALGNYKINVMLYNTDTSSTSAVTKPIGIFLQHYDLTNNPIINIWNGASTVPKVRLGYLAGITYNGSSLGTNQNNSWGLYSNSVFLEGNIIANGGKIGGYTIGTSNLTKGTTQNASGSFWLTPEGQSTAMTTLNSSALTWGMTVGTQFGVTTSGVLYASGAVIKGALTATSLSTGTKTASTTGNGVFIDSSGNIYAGNGSTNNFTVTAVGAMTATGANILTATIGNATSKMTLGTGTSGNSAIYSGMTTLASTANGFYVGTDGIALGGGKFKVTNAGYLTSTSGSIGGNNITASSIYSGSKSSYNSSNTGFFLGSDGKFGVGTSTNYLTFDGTNLKVTGNIEATSLTIQSNATISGDGASQILNSEIEIGGRNLFLNSMTERVSPASTSASAYVSPVVTLTSYGDSVLNNTTDIFTYSFDYEVTGNSTSEAYIYAQIRGSSIQNSLVISANNNNTSNKQNHYINDNPTGKYVCTFTINSTQASATSTTCNVRLRNATDGAILKIWNVKLEKGNKATDWSPAPEDTQSEINNTRSWYAICDTDAATTAKVATITPATTDFTSSVLTAGTVIFVKFTVTNSGAVGSLTLNVNGTGAKPIKTTRNGSLTTIAGAGYIVANATYQFIYDGTNWIMQENYNANTYDRTYHNNPIKAATAITANHIICGTSAGYKNIGANVAFDLSYPILYSPNAISAGSTRSDCYIKIPSINATNNGTITNATQFAILYLKGTLNNNTFTISASPFLTCTIPNDNDGFCYIPLGIMTNNASPPTTIYFESSDQLYKYVDGAFGPVSMRQALAAAKTATNCITEISNTGIWVTPSGKKPDANGDVVVDSTTGTLINADGVGIYKDGNCVAKYGSSVTIGNDSDELNLPYIYIDNNDFNVFDSNHAKALSISSDGALLTTEKRIRKTLEISTYSDSFNNPTTQTVTIDCATRNLPTGSNYNAEITFSFYGKHKDANDNSWQFFKEGNSVKIEDIKNAGSSGLNMQIPYQDYSNFWGINFIYNSQSQIITAITSMSSTGQQYMKQIFVTLKYYFYTETTESLTPYCSIGSRKEDTTLGAYSITGGYDIEASGNYSQSFGCGTIAQGKYQTVIGSYNLPQGANNSIEMTNFAFIIGNGSENDSRTNAFAIDWNGTAHLRSIRSIRHSYANPCSDGDAYEEILVGNMTYRAQTIYSQPVDIAAWISATIIALCQDYPGKVQAIFKGRIVPNSAAYFEICIYDTSTTARAYDYMPQYAYGVYRQWPNAYWIIWVNNYVFNYKAL